MPHPLPNPLRAFVPQSLRAFLTPLLLGLLTTIAIAWASAACVTFSDSGWDILPDPKAAVDYSLHVRRYRGLAVDRVCWETAGWIVGFKEDESLLIRLREAAPLFERAGLFPRWWGSPPALPDEMLQATLPRAAGSRFEHVQDARGWPFVALWCEWPCQTLNGYRMAAVKGGITLPPRLPTGHACDSLRALPLRPVPAGLAANTLIFAALYWLSFLTLHALRSRLRKRRNLCPNCAYPRRGLPPASPCPECGRQE